MRCEQYKDPLEKLISDKRLSHLSEAGRKAFVELALSGPFEGERADGPIKRKSTYNPYIYQVEMLFRGSNRGKPGIVTSGTGSGKTESFMLPRSGDLRTRRRSGHRPRRNSFRSTGGRAATRSSTCAATRTRIAPNSDKPAVAHAFSSEASFSLRS